MNYDTSEIHKYYTHRRMTLVTDVELFLELYAVFMRNLFWFEKILLYFSAAHFKKRGSWRMENLI
jgi:hypothetical protein